METKALLLFVTIVAVSCQKHQEAEPVVSAKPSGPTIPIVPDTPAYPLNLTKKIAGNWKWEGYDSMFYYGGYTSRVPIYPTFAISAVSDSTIIVNNLQYWTPNTLYDSTYLTVSAIDTISGIVTFSYVYNADYGYACALSYFYKQDSIVYGETYWNYMGNSWFTLINTK